MAPQTRYTLEINHAGPSVSDSCCTTPTINPLFGQLTLSACHSPTRPLPCPQHAQGQQPRILRLRQGKRCRERGPRGVRSRGCTRRGDCKTIRCLWPSPLQTLQEWRRSKRRRACARKPEANQTFLEQVRFIYVLSYPSMCLSSYSLLMWWCVHFLDLVSCLTNGIGRRT